MIKKLLLSVLAIFSFAVLMSQNSYAVSDKTLTFQQGSSAVDICYIGDLDCSSYNYLLVSPSSDFDGRFTLSYTVNNNNSGSYLFPNSNMGLISPVLFDISGLSRFYLSFISNVISSGSVTVTLSENNPYSTGIVPVGTLNITENGTFDVTNYASAVVNVDQTISDLPPYSELVVDSFWKYHVAIAGGLASIFAIFVVYRIIKSRIR